MKHFYKILAIAFCLMYGQLYAQVTLRGTVTDVFGYTLVGVNVVEKGTNRGTTTDFEGNFEITYKNADAIIVFSYIGYVTQEVKPGGNTELNVVLQEEILNLSGIEVVGTRSLNRSSTETPVAIDIIPIAEVINSVGQLDLNQLLQFAAPSFNSNRQSGADGSDHIDPATLRGLGPDQTLVLINGKRRHQSSLVNIFGTRGRGNTGTDLNAIPASAIERIEILRDGASAQYGSDAIAGVINIVLKSNTDEFTGNIFAGVRKAKFRTDKDFDGETLQLSGNYGLGIGKGGFVNLTTDYQRRNKTNRPADPDVYDIYREQFGDAESDNFAAFFNSKVPVSDNLHFYAFGGLNHRFTDAYAWTRDPESIRNVPEIYPDGFNPRIQSNIADRSASVGLRGKVGNWDLDFNNTFGSNRFHYYIDGTLNASLLSKSPTRFDAGGFQLSQNTTGLNFTRFFPEALSGISVAFGSEYRIDNYQIFAGEEGSYRNYGLVDTVVNGYVTQVDILGRPGGSQGFPGFQPADETNENRTNLAAYLDAEFDFTDKFMVGAAVRAERYSDFGNTVNGKIAARYEVSKRFAFRASASTGFRAPSLPQIFFSSTFTDFVSGVAVDKIIAPNNSPITRVLGIPQLKEETSLNASFGFTTKPFNGFTATVDGYFVDIQDRIVLTGAFEDTDPDIGADLQALGVGAAQFFTNAVDTRTLGVDIILTYARRIGSGRLQATFAGNINNMTVEDIKTNDKLTGKEDIYFGNRDKLFLLASAPPSKMNLTLDYKIKRFNANLRFVHFAKVELEDWIGTVDVYDPRVTTDITLGYSITNNFNLTIGGANIFNAYPTTQDTETETGGLWDAVQMGFSGSLYFAKLGFKF
ncbi:MAG: TonB-dependent receptor [Sphingobacteriales bacterium]|nr:MAG: TonB-dependent receptor [Sphingobacteriales bacterium]